MKWSWPASFVAGAIIAFLLASTPQDKAVAITDFLTNDEQNNIAVFQAASPSVVFVTNTQLRRQRFSLNVMEIPQGSGTGFIWDKTGLIVTNFHVVYGANKITITLQSGNCLLYTSPSPRDLSTSRMPSSA